MAAELFERRVVVMLTSVGNEAIHGFASDLRRRAPRWELVGTDMRADAAGLYVCDQAFTVPPAHSPEYLTAMAELCDRVGADVVLPLSTRDQDLFCRSEVRAALGDRPTVVSPPEKMNVANRKIALFEHLGASHPLLPDHRIVDSPADAVDALSELTARYGAALLKSDIGTGGEGILFVGEPPPDPTSTHGRIFRPLEAVRAAAEGGLPALQPDLVMVAPMAEQPPGAYPKLAVAHLPGAEYSVDLLSSDGNVLAGAVRLRRAAVGGLALVAETVDAPDVFEAGREVVQATGVSFVNNVQFRRDAAGAPRLIEMNPRIPGTVGLTVEAGLNLPLAAIALALGVHVPLPSPELGVNVMRYHGSVFTRRPAPPAAAAS